MLRKRRKEKAGKAIKCHGRREKRAEGKASRSAKGLVTLQLLAENTPMDPWVLAICSVRIIFQNY